MICIEFGGFYWLAEMDFAPCFKFNNITYL